MKQVALIGTGLIGGSVGLALRREGLVVRGLDRDPTRADDAKRLGVLDEVARSVAEVVAGADLVVVAVPVGRIADVVVEALDAGATLVTDVGSAKGGVVAAVEAARPALAPRFVGGHPMAGSEQDGLDGADADLFVGATWVLTPTERTDSDAFQAVRGVVRELGAEVLAVTPDHHDALVAMVSHVPQLAATTLMDVAARRGEEHATLLRLAAGGFRDMTRIAASAPGIWSDICVANGDAIVVALDHYLDALQQVRALIVDADDTQLLELLERARAARRNLPIGIPPAEELVELRVPVRDRPGVLAEVTTLAGRLAVNIVDVEIAHSLEGGGGVLVLVVPADSAAALEAALTERGYHHARASLS
jgi:prephenate dehydrogenase